MFLVYALICLGLVIIYFGFSRFFMQTIFLLFWKITGSKKIAMHLLSIFLLPGTIVHELSHFIMAVFLGVRTGTINIIPKQNDDGQIIAGETQIARCDPIRYSIIGLAPFISGLIIIYSINRFYIFDSINFDTAFFPEIGQVLARLAKIPLPGLGLAAAVLVWVPNTMFSSKKDLQVILVPIALLYTIGFVLFFSGFKAGAFFGWLAGFDLFFKELAFFLLVVMGLNLLVGTGVGLLGRLLSLAKRN